MNEKDEFIFRCKILEPQLRKTLELDESDRVRISVLNVLMTEIILRQEKPVKCLHDAILGLQMTYDDMINK